MILHMATSMASRTVFLCSRSIYSSLLCQLILCVFFAQKSWDIALAPVKQLPMNLFIMWMSGNTISIFPIMMVAMMFFRPIQALFNYSQSKHPLFHVNDV